MYKMLMGIPPEPIEYGNNCLTCWAPGKAPKYIHAVFSGIIYTGVMGRSPPNGTFKLTQEPGHNCQWWGRHKEWTIFFTPASEPPVAGFSWLSARQTKPPFDGAFAASTERTCVFALANELEESPFTVYYGGQGRVITD